MAELPQKNTLIENIAAYQSERNIFLSKQYEFKFGNVKYAVGAAVSMRSMYVELLGSLHQDKFPEEAKQFRSELDALYSTMAALQNRDELSNPALAVKHPDFLSAVKKHDEVYWKLKGFKHKLGFE